MVGFLKSSPTRFPHLALPAAVPTLGPAQPLRSAEEPGRPWVGLRDLAPGCGRAAQERGSCSPRSPRDLRQRCFLFFHCPIVVSQMGCPHLRPEPRPGQRPRSAPRADAAALRATRSPTGQSGDAVLRVLLPTGLAPALVGTRDLCRAAPRLSRSGPQAPPGEERGLLGP